MEESLEDFLKRDMNDQIEELFFFNFINKGQAIPPIKEKTESPFLDNNMEKILNQIKYEEEYEKYDNLNKNTLHWKVMIIGGYKSGEIAQNSASIYLHKYEPNTMNKADYEHFDILFKGKRLEIKFSAVFDFACIKPDYFDYILFIGLDEYDNFYFNLMSREEVVEYITSHNLVKGACGYSIYAHKDSPFFQKYGNHLTYSDIANYIKD